MGLTVALNRLGIDEVGLDATDRKILHTIADKFDGGPVGLNNLSTVGEESDTIFEKYEPFLIMKGFMQRTQQGRVITAPVVNTSTTRVDKASCFN